MTVIERIRQYIIGSVAVPVADDSDIFELGLVDSLYGLQLVSFVEQEFEISVDGDDLDIANFCSIAALSEFVTAKLARGS
jgi:methoxymalonate biosynthesis acyl carrier protein